MAGGEVHYTDPASIAQFGTYAAQLTTRIASKYDAENRANLILARQSQPAWVLSGIIVDLELITKLSDITAEQDEEMTAAILDLEMHDAISVADMPPGSPYAEVQLFVEGWTETISWGKWRIDVAVSEYRRTAALTRWDDVDDLTTWDTAPDITWDEVRDQWPS